MKLNYLWVEEFKNLKNFEVDLSGAAEEPCTVILGRNGLGKSNLLEVLVVIFRDLYLGNASHFWYRLRYTIGQGRTHISIENQPRTSSANSIFSFDVTNHTSEERRVGKEGRCRRLPH